MYKRFEFQLIERFQFLCRYIRLFEYSITYSCIPPYLHIWDGILSNYCISIYMFQLLRILRLEWYIDLPVPCLLCGGKNCERGFFQKSWKIEKEMEGRKVNWKKKKKRNKGNILFGEKTHRYKCSWNFREVWRWRECGPSSFPFEVYAANVSWQFHSLQTLIRHRECEARSYFCKKKLGFSFNPFQLFQFQF